MSAEAELARRIGVVARARERIGARRRERWDSYDAFISYSRADVAFATRLQTDLERFAKPWNRPRSAKIFRDVSSLTPQAALREAIESGLRRSRWLILCLSPEAAQSRWVNQEIAWWREHRDSQSILLVLAHGTIAWDEAAGDFDTARSTAVPPELLGAFDAEPVWLDAAWSRSGLDDRMPDVVADVSATLRGVPKEELYGVALAEHRRTMRLARGAQIGLATLLLTAVVAAVVALEQRGNAVEQATAAESRQLAAISLSEARSNLDVSMLLAVQAHRRDRNAQTDAALLRAALESPRLVRYFNFRAAVSSLAASRDGRVMVAGLSDGSVYRWPLRAPAPQRVARFGRRVTHVAVDADASTIAASDAKGALVWRADERATPVEIPEGQTAGTVAVSPSGRTVAVETEGAVAGGESSIVFASPSRRVVREPGGSAVGRVLLPSDREIVLLDLAGGFERRRISGWRLTDPRRIGMAPFGVRQAPGEPSADGEYITGSNGFSPLPVWRTRAPVPRDARLVAEPPITGYGETALDAHGRHLAAAESGTIYVAEVVRRGRASPVPVTLTGTGDVDVLRFARDDGSAVLAASRRRVALYDLDQVDRLARVTKVALPSGCTACQAADVTVSPDGRRAALIDGNGLTAILHSLATRRPDEVVAETDIASYELAGAMWADDSRFVAIPFDPQETDAMPSQSPPPSIRFWQAGDAVDDVIAVGRVRGGEAATVTQRGDVALHDLESGEVRATYDGPADFEIGDARLTDAAVAPGGDHIAYADRRVVVILRASTGERVRRLVRPEVQSLAFGGDRLVIQLVSGELEVWSADGSRLERTVAGDESFVWDPVVAPDGGVAARRRANNEIGLVDLDTGATLATVPPNPGAGGLRVGVGFSADGRRMVTVTDERDYQGGAVVVDRDISSEALVASLCRVAGRDLTEAEWRRFVGTSAPDDLRC